MNRESTLCFAWILYHTIDKLSLHSLPKHHNNYYHIVSFICCAYLFLRSCVFVIIFAGWTSNSKYTLLGALRAAAQTFSFEMCFITLLLPIFLLNSTFNLIDIVIYQKYYWNFFTTESESLVNFYFFYFFKYNEIREFLLENRRTIFEG